MHITWEKITSPELKDQDWWLGTGKNGPITVRLSVFTLSTCVQVSVNDLLITSADVWLQNEATTLIRPQQPLTPMAWKLIDRLVDNTRKTHNLLVVMTTDAFAEELTALSIDPYARLSEQNKAMADGIIASYDKAELPVEAKPEPVPEANYMFPRKYRKKP